MSLLICISIIHRKLILSMYMCSVLLLTPSWPRNRKRKPVGREEVPKCRLTVASCLFNSIEKQGQPYILGQVDLLALT